MRQLPLGLSLLFVLAACGPGDSTCDAGVVEPPPLTAQGAWRGTYECNNTLQKVSGAFATNAAGQIDGEMFLDYVIMILGQPFTLTGRADVDEGQTVMSGYTAWVDVLDNSQGLADFDLTLALNDDGDELDGDLSRTNAEGEVTLTCPIHLERIEVTDLPPDNEPDPEPTDGG